MKIELLTTRRNPLLGRNEVTFEVEEMSTPSRTETRKELASLLKKDMDLVWLIKMQTKTGTHKTVGKAHVYEDPSRALEVEPAHIIERNKLIEEPTTEEEGEN